MLVVVVPLLSLIIEDVIKICFSNFELFAMSFPIKSSLPKFKLSPPVLFSPSLIVTYPLWCDYRLLRDHKRLKY